MNEKQNIKVELSEEQINNLNKGGIVIYDTPMFRFEMRVPWRYRITDEQIQEIKQQAYNEGAEKTYDMFRKILNN